MGGVSDERTARALLTRLAEPGDRVVGAWLRRGTAVDAVAWIVDGGDDVRERFELRLQTADPEADLARAAEVGGRFLVPGDLEWPAQLDDLGDARPWGLWVRGTADLRMSMLRSVAIVGARAATPYGRQVAASFGAELARAGWTVVSGGAFGIDSDAHQGALAVGGLTAAVLACGVDVAYPPSNDGLFARIAADGMLVSEVPPGAAPHRLRFLVRNRVIAALTRGTVVVEAALRSGSLSTAAEADKMGRPVLGVPGQITSAMSAGVHRALRRGALLVTSPAEVVEALGDLGVDLAPEPSGERRPRDDLDELTARVLDGVPARRPATLESIARTIGVTTGEAAAGLGLLELGGYVVRGPQGWRLAPGAPR